MHGIKPVRISARKKTPMQRLGNPVPTTSKGKKKVSKKDQALDNDSTTQTVVQVTPSPATAPPPIVKSVKSGGSSCSSATLERRKILLQANAEEKMSKLEEELIEKRHEIEKRMIKLEFEMNMDRREIAAKEEECKSKECSLEKKAQNQSSILDLTKELNTKNAELSSLMVDMKYLVESYEQRKTRVLQMADSEKKIAEVDAQIEEDLDADWVSLPEEVSKTVDKTKLTTAWAATSLPLDNDQDEDEEKIQALTSRLLKISNPTINPTPVGGGGNIAAPPPRNPLLASYPQQQPDFTALGQASTMIAQAIQQVLGSQPIQQQSHSTDRFLARQVQGRDLPSFDGHPEQWPGFIAAYESSTKTCQYTNADNLVRLQKCLRGDAIKSVQCLLISPNSVPIVIQQLKKRFGSPEHIIKSMMAKVRETPPVKAEKLESLIEFGIAVQNLRGTIIALSCPQHLSNPILLQELVDKLPVQQQLQWMSWVQMNPTNPKSIDSFADWIETQTDLACQLCPPTFKTESTRPPRGRTNQQDRVHAVTTEGKKKQDYVKGRERKCPCCNKLDHRIQSCPTFAKMTPRQKWEFARDNQCCYGCLNFGHSTKDCRSKKDCGLDGCTRDHHKLLHFTKEDQAPRRRPPDSGGEFSGQDTNAPDSVAAINGSVHTVTPSGFVSLKVIPVVLRGPNGKKMEVLAFLDDGSTLTLIDEDVARELNLAGIRGPDKTLNITCFQTNVALSTKTVEVEMESVDGKIVRTLRKVKTTPNISLPPQQLRTELLKKYDHLRGINFSTYDMGKPKILIGMDHADIVLSRQVRFGRGNAPIATRTLFGWALCGPVPFHSREKYGYHVREIMDDELHQFVKEQFTTEAFGVKPSIEAPRSRDDIRAQKILDSTLVRVSDGWETGLLWKDDEVQLPESRRMAMKRLATMERKMDSDPEFARQYIAKIEDYKRKGFARVLSPEEAAVETSRTYYLPHFMAINPKKPTKLRFVFDAAAKSHGSSLNDHLLQGPDKLVSLPGVLLKFRQRRIGFTADIQDMFHRVKVRKEDAQSQRFLWRGMDRTRDPHTLEMEVLFFGASCSPACAQEAKNRNAEDYKEEFPAAYHAIVRRHYVDDYLDSCDTPEEAIKMYQDVHTVQAKGSFNLCNWLSNSEEMMAAIPEELRAEKAKNLDVGGDSLVERVLGMFWKPSPDIFTFSLSYLKTKEDLLTGDRIPTKRELLALTMSIYDPLGLITVLTIKARALLQATWRSKVDWNEEIPIPARPLWMKWIEEVRSLPTFQVSRCYSPNLSSADEVQLHVFGDAGEEAFGAAAYLVVKKNEEIHTSLVMSKARVAPMKTLSIPRLELQAALMCSRLAQFIKTELEIPITRTILWSDSSTVIGWIRADGKKFHQFVAHRVGEIQELSDASQWKWIPTALNVADELTRMDRPCNWSPSSRWLNGPDFLQLPEEYWPKEKAELVNSELDGEEFELRKNQLFVIRQQEPFLDPNKFSSWTRLVRTTAYVLRFVELVASRKFSAKHQLAKKKETNGNSSSLTIVELEKAEQWWWKFSQRTSFPAEYEALASNQSIANTSRLIKATPYLDEVGVMRVRGRIDNAEGISVSVKRPVILDKNSQCAQLIVRHYHWTCDHHGHERIVNEIRQKYYIPHLRAAVKKVKMSCQACNNLRSKPSVPEMGLLPKYRLDSNVHPFTATGVDYFGPIEVVVKRSRQKRYGVLFTCLSTRALHLEVANSLTTDSCILAIRRFVGRRGCPRALFSDNGTNFHGARNELAQSLEELNQSKI